MRSKSSSRAVQLVSYSIINFVIGFFDFPKLQQYYDFMYSWVWDVLDDIMQHKYIQFG